MGEKAVYTLPVQATPEMTDKLYMIRGVGPGCDQLASINAIMSKTATDLPGLYQSTVASFDSATVHTMDLSSYKKYTNVRLRADTVDVYAYTVSAPPVAGTTVCFSINRVYAGGKVVSVALNLGGEGTVAFSFNSYGCLIAQYYDGDWVVFYHNAGVIDTPQLAEDAVTTLKIADAQVTRAKLDANFDDVYQIAGPTGAVSATSTQTSSVFQVVTGAPKRFHLTFDFAAVGVAIDTDIRVQLESSATGTGGWSVASAFNDIVVLGATQTVTREWFIPFKLSPTFWRVTFTSTADAANSFNISETLISLMTTT